MSVYFRNAVQPKIARKQECTVTRFLTSAKSFWTLGQPAHRRDSATARAGNTDAPGAAVLQILRKEV